MGSLVTLGVGHLEVDWGKNQFSRNHSALFLPADLAVVPYYYADGIVEQKQAFTRPLCKVLPRLELLGYTLSDCERHYSALVEEWPDWYDSPALSYEDFAHMMCSVDPTRVRLLEDDGGDYSLGAYVTQVVLSDPEFTNTFPALAALDRDQGTFFENLDPYVVLRLLAENQVALGADVTWRFADVIEGGWQEEQALYEGVPSASRCLIVTEGSTDSLILSRSLAVVAPDLVDFFDFVDMSENYPFTGTGNLYRFCQGLARIQIQNRILVVFDNDSAGRAAYNKVAALALPRRMKVALLPQLSRLQAVCTVGPSGSAECDVNGLAVSIECFLDIWSDVNRPPVIRWMAYMPETQTYQGELAGKSDYLTSFLEAVKRGTPYDYSALRFLWQYLLGVTSGA